MFSFGSDPEFMMTHESKLISAIKILPPKSSPLKHLGHSFYYDNVLAEIAIKPGNSKEEVLENTRAAIKYLCGPKYQATIQAAAEYPDSEMEDPKAREAGCKKEWCVYTISQPSLPEGSLSRSNLRTAGGHIHLGGNDLVLNDKYRPQLIMMMDLFLGIPSVLLESDPSEVQRRRIYGLAGRHRKPQHGLEYRVLSNFWFASPNLVSLIYDLTEFVIQFVGDDGFYKLWRIDEELLYGDHPAQGYICHGYDAVSLQKQINTCNRWGAEEFLAIVKEHLPDNLLSLIQTSRKSSYRSLGEEWGF